MVRMGCLSATNDWTEELCCCGRKASWSLEHAKLKARMEVLQRNQKHYMGDELDNLSTRERQNLEHPPEGSLKHTRARENQLMNESITELQKK
ncbi:hypothetical protein MIMGU_mgv1a020411mg, partial [Erythranthe guttata]